MLRRQLGARQVELVRSQRLEQVLYRYEPLPFLPAKAILDEKFFPRRNRSHHFSSESGAAKR